MKKYNTRPIDFTGCHPVIAEALKRHEDIKCRVWDSDSDRGQEVETWVCRYRGNSNLPYRSDSDAPWKHAEPIARKVRRIMPPERAIPVLIANGWKFNPSGQMDGPVQTIQTIFPAMLCHMGARLDDPDTTPWSWPPCIIEEVEDDE